MLCNGSIFEQANGKPAAMASTTGKPESLERRGVEHRGCSPEQIVQVARSIQPVNSTESANPSSLIKALDRLRVEAANARHHEPELGLLRRKRANARSRFSRFLCGCSVETHRKKGSGRELASSIELRLDSKGATTMRSSSTR